ncbi:phosphatidylinositol 3,4,5-trisphosphate-dependent Rac exchanger 1 protein-like, partial [Nannospalax galili]|uniref:phosphatidylinositol 3,4,5-trisphosphate-dependent Rac exchanger 1 protein-like n=1 Tax=Nannospalax galili TaxID=1026970 RepID=UPI00111C6644
MEATDGGGDPGGDGAQPNTRVPGSGPCVASRESERQLRLCLCVLNEILSTERDYVGTLRFLQSSHVHSAHRTLVVLLSNMAVILLKDLHTYPK